MASSGRPLKPDLPWTDRLLLSYFTLATDLSCRPNFTVNRCLLNFLDFKCSPSLTPDSNGVRSFDVVVDASRRPLISPLHPNRSASRRLLCLGVNSKPVDDFCWRLTKELKAVVSSVNYRLSPKHKCPPQYDDGFDVSKFIDQNPNFSVAMTSAWE